MGGTVAGQTCRTYSASSKLEWLLTNGIGGFASGTVSGVNTRRYHGLLVAATRPPAVRNVLLAAVDASVVIRGHAFSISTNEYYGAVHPQGFRDIESFSYGDSVRWTYSLEGHEVTKSVTLHQGVNAVTVRYRNNGPVPVTLNLTPLVSHKFYHANFRADDAYPSGLNFGDGNVRVSHQGIDLFLIHPGAERELATGWYYRFRLGREEDRGLEAQDDLFCPCTLNYTLQPGEEAVLVASTEPDTNAVPESTLEPEACSALDQLKRAAGHFLVSTNDRTSIIAGYPWFTDWGRDTMIALPGLCLETGRVDTAREILRSYAGQLAQGLIPNRFVDDGEVPEYNTVDATLWFANAVYLTLEKEWDEVFARDAYGWLREVAEWHFKGTRYGIKVDSADGLLMQGEDGVQLTWMDAKVGDWVVTPRHGKPVEINGLWCNLLRIVEHLGSKLGEDASDVIAAAEKVEESMRTKFWHPMVGHFLDTVEPDDATLRPNQLIAMGLPFAPLTGDNAVQVLAKVDAELLTPFGLRTLGPSEPGYQKRYEGPLSKRDAAYHQGTVWPWLIGPYVSAVLNLTSDVQRASSALRFVEKALSSHGLGGIAEVYDGDAPQFPDGCPWQAWSVGAALQAFGEIERAQRG